MVAIKGEPFLSGMHPSPEFLSKALAQKDLRLLEILSPRSDLLCTHTAASNLACIMPRCHQQMLQNGGFKSAVDKFTESAVRQCESAGVERLLQMWHCTAERSWPDSCHMLLRTVRRPRSCLSTALQLSSVPSQVQLCQQCLQSSKQPALQQKTCLRGRLRKLSSLSACCCERYHGC